MTHMCRHIRTHEENAPDGRKWRRRRRARTLEHAQATNDPSGKVQARARATVRHRGHRWPTASGCVEERDASSEGKGEREREREREREICRQREREEARIEETSCQ